MRRKATLWALQTSERSHEKTWISLGNGNLKWET